jgi:hypothetical protein
VSTKTWTVNTKRRAVYVGEDAALIHEVEANVNGSFEVLKHFTLREVMEMAEDLNKITRWHEHPSGAGEVCPPVALTLSFTAKEYFEKEVASSVQYENSRDILLEFSSYGEAWVHSKFFFNTTEDAGREDMANILIAWANERGCDLDEFIPIHKDVPNRWKAAFEYPKTGSTVSEACEFGTDVIELVKAYQARSLDRDGVLAVVRAGRASVLIGLPEGPSLEVKRPLKLDDTPSKLNLSKQAAAMANALNGGVIIIGASTQKVDGRDTINQLHGFAATQLIGKTYKIFRQYIYPPIANLRVESSGIGQAGEILLIDIPAQPEELRPFMVHGIVIDGNVNAGYISIPEREGEDTFFANMAAVHARLQAGRRQQMEDPVVTEEF